MNVAEFNTTFHIRAPGVMWFLGAGASASGNIKTAGAMIWDFKRRLYCRAQRVPLAACADLSVPVLQARLQSFFDAAGTFPLTGADDEYAAFFEAVYPTDGDRRRYIENCVREGTPSYGHIALAALLKLNRVRVVWTTNFDRLIEDAAVAALGGTGHLVVSTTDNATIAGQALNEGRWPLLVKLHGDFQSRRLKNIDAELRAQDEDLRHALVRSCERWGLAVIGYSGRDASVMDALEAVLEHPNPFPQGLFWFHRPDAPPNDRVCRLVERAAAAGTDAHLVAVETFDELFGDLMLLEENLPEELRDRLSPMKGRVSDAPIPPAGESFPVIRLNALPIIAAPTHCRRVECAVGGAHDTRAAVAAAGADILVARRKVGVLAFGKESDIRRTFAPFGIRSYDLHSIETRRLLHTDSAELGLLLDALARALKRERPVITERRRSRYLLIADTARPSDPAIAELTRAAGELGGRVATTQLEWAEATWLRLEYRLGRLWLLLEPTIWVATTEDQPQYDAGRAFIRERLARRRNVQTYQVLDAWVRLITGGSIEATLAAYGIGDEEGIDARFTVSQVTAFSRRLAGRGTWSGRAAPPAAGQQRGTR